ncbi:MAG: hypothetical protein LBJ62_05790 [Bifidobacteriaceae bacterium]|jgi:hypothetical protein|nr:hypothetical protein [Bifidobacteriaceae bacterium]
MQDFQDLKDFDMSQLTLGEIGQIEKLSGQPITEIGGPGQPLGAGFAALYMVFKRRNGFPGFNFADAGRVSMEQATREMFPSATAEAEPQTKSEVEAAANSEHDADELPMPVYTYAEPPLYPTLPDRQEPPR